LDLAIEWLQTQNIDLSSSEAKTKIREILNQLAPPNATDLSGKWIYRCVFRIQHLGTSSTITSLGLASVNENRGALTVLSIAGRTEFNVSSTSDRGRVTGKWGVATVASGDCDGVATQDKISLSGNGRTDDGMVQLNLTLQR
jgi:hypothetical protein